MKVLVLQMRDGTVARFPKVESATWTQFTVDFTVNGAPSQVNKDLVASAIVIDVPDEEIRKRMN